MEATLTQRFYDRISHVYDLIADGGEHEARERGLSVLNVKSGESVLEVGYGTGHSIVALSNAVGVHGRVTGIDISPGMQKVAQKRVTEADLQAHVELLVGDVPPISVDDNSQDVVTTSFTLELFPLETIPTVLQEIRRVLKLSGRFGLVSMATVTVSEPESVMEKTYKWMHTHFPHIVDCQPINAEQLVKDAGFKIVHSERYDLFTMPVAILVATASN